MTALRLHRDEPRLRLERVPVPAPRGTEVLVRVAATGVCRSDLHLAGGGLDQFIRFPVTLGHETAGWVAAVGSDARAWRVGHAVLATNGWGCGACTWCREGRDQICLTGETGGASRDGGFADYILIPHGRYLVALGDLDPVESAPLADAGMTSYAALRRARPHLAPDRALVVIGLGGLGQCLVQFARATVEAPIVAIDPRNDRRDAARNLGADLVLDPGDSVADRVRAWLDGRAVGAVIDLVGDADTYHLAVFLVDRGGLIAMVGLGDGVLPVGFRTLAPEASFTTVHAGTVRDLAEVVELASRGLVHLPVQRYRLSEARRAFADLEAGLISGRAVLQPDEGGETGA